MVKNTKEIKFYFPYKIILIHSLVEIFSYLICLTPLLIAVILRVLFGNIFSELFFRILVTIAINMGIVILIYFIVYKKIYIILPELIYLNYIKKNIPCPNCKNYLSYYKKKHPYLKKFYEHIFVCELCKTESEIENDLDSRGLRTKWILFKKRPLKLDIKEYKKIIENVKDEEEFGRITEKLGLKYNDVVELNKAYNIQFNLDKQLEYDKKVRIFTYISLIIWAFIGIIFYYFYQLYDLDTKIDFIYIFAVFCLFYTLTLIIYAWNLFEKKYSNYF